MLLTFPLFGTLVDCGANIPATFAPSPQQADKVDLPRNLLGPHYCTVKSGVATLGQYILHKWSVYST